MVKQSCSPESMSAITSSFSLLEKTTPTGSGSLYDRITGFSSNEKAKFSGGRRSSNSTEKSYHIDSYSLPTIQPALARTPQRGRLETTVLDVDNVISPKRHNVTDTSSNVSFLDCTITPIKREKARASPATAKNRLERSINTSKTFSLNSSEGEEARGQIIADEQEWRAVKDPVSGKIYFYNRLTRVSKWKLPKGAVLRQKRSTNNTSFATAVTDESNKQDSERKDSHVISSPQSSEHTSSPLSSDDTNIVTTATTGDNIKSPQDTTAGLLFCLYCGVCCRSLSMLESHLPQCSCFIRMQEPGLLSKQLEIERVLFSLWSKNGSNEQASHTSGNKGLHQSPFKETGVFSSSRGLFQSPFNENTKERRDDEDSYTVSPPKFNIREHKNTNDFCIDKKTCPFCEEALFGGDNFSSHLLICKERKRRRNRRRTPKNHSVVEECSPRIRAGVRTPGRRMPWE
jgi:hypothetical protein